MDSIENDIEELEELSEFQEEVFSLSLLTPEEQESLFSSLKLPPYWTKAQSPFQAFMLLDGQLNIKWYNNPMGEIFTNERIHQSGNFSRLLNLNLANEHHLHLLQDIKKEENRFYRREFLHVNLPLRGPSELLLIMLPLLSDQDRPEYYFTIIEDQTREQKQLINRTFQSLLEASLLKDNDTGQHVQRVNLYSKLVAETLFKKNKLGENNHFFIEDISYLAAMHDVGKIGTPDDILNKEGPLEEWEMRIMKEHTTNGAFILSNYPNPMAREIALNHHENWDGTGYPYAKQGEMIPLSARIVAMADVYDALRSKRSYKKSWSHERTCKEINALSGTKFDPSLVHLFNEIHQDFNAIWDSMKDTGLKG